MKLNKRFALRSIAVVGLIATMALAVFAAVRLSKSSFTDKGTTLQSCFKLTGLGNEDVTITVSTTGTASTTCTNPGGNNPPGQQVPVSPSGSTTIPSNQIKNGTVTVCLTTVEPTVTSEQAGCPRPFTATVNDVQFQTATVKVEQGGKTVLVQQFDLP